MDAPSLAQEIWADLPFYGHLASMGYENGGISEEEVAQRASGERAVVIITSLVLYHTADTLRSTGT